MSEQFSPQAKKRLEDLKAAIEVGISYLPDGYHYEFIWDEMSSDEQEQVKVVRKQMQEALKSLELLMR